MNFTKTLERCFSNMVIVAVVGQIPPLTFLPEEGLTVPIAVALGVAGVDLYGAVKGMV